MRTCNGFWTISQEPLFLLVFAHTNKSAQICPTSSFLTKNYFLKWVIQVLTIFRWTILAEYSEINSSFFFLSSADKKKSKKEKREKSEATTSAATDSSTVDFMIQPEKETPKIDTTK